MRKGRKNIYACQVCESEMITVDRDHGVTPMMKRCEICKSGFAYSSFYNVDQGLEPQYEWYAPSKTEAKHYDEEMKEYVRRGGLAFRKIEEKAPS